jgi:secreted PhoX family phosphatase
MAFQCDVTRVVSYMLEDERSEFIYSHVPLRNFTAAGSAPAPGTQVCGNYHGAQHAGNTNDDFSTISW